MPWSAWLEKCWLRLRDWGQIAGDLRLLSERQEDALWRQILGDLPIAGHVLMPGDLAREAARAHALMQSYEVTIDEIVREGGRDARIFAEAASLFTRRCKDDGWCDHASLAGWLALHHAEALSEIISGEMVLVGFDVMSPAQTRLLDRLAEYGVEITTPGHGRPATSVGSLTCSDSRNELLAAANWAHGVLQRDPESRIGVALPDLEARSVELGDIFDDVLSPQSVLPGHVHDRSVWNQSLGRPLSDWPVVDTAVRALRLAIAPCSYKDIGLLLRSPYLGGVRDECGDRGRMDAWLREQGFFEMSLGFLATQLAGNVDSNRPSCPILAGRLRSALEIWDSASSKQLPGDWSRLFDRLLNALGWPGDRTVDSAEMQVITKFNHELAAMMLLDEVVGSVGRAEAINLFSRGISNTIFQPEQTSSPVQVMGLLEATGLEFDHLWVAGFSHRNWPRSIRPNSLLPAGIQRTAGMPRSCVKTELEFSRRLVERFLGASDDVVFSWSEQDEQETLRPSPLLPPATVPVRREETQYEGAATQVLGTAKLEFVDDFGLPPLAGSGVISGGTAVLKSQSACPFQAQARYRLFAKSLESPHPGLDRRTSGMIVHEALDQLWRRWRNRDGLISAENWRQQISDAVDKAIRQLRLGDRKNRTAMLEIEHGRLCQLINILIDQERERDDFEIIDSEKSISIELPGLTLRTRSDRLDRTASGATLIVDYKSGLARVGDWLGERPVDPQLLIYAVGSKAPVDGLAFAILKAGQVGYRGISTDPAEIPGVRSIDASRGLPEGVVEWPDLVAFWRKVVHGLADEFTGGRAAVAPRDPSVCRYCDLTALCRRADLAHDARTR